MIIGEQPASQPFAWAGGDRALNYKS